MDENVYKARRRSQANILKLFRKIHRTTGAMLFLFFFIVALSGLFLGWKKHSGGAILAKSYQGTSTDMKDWLPMDVLTEKAVDAARSTISPDISPALDRIDVRPDKGMIKFVFVEGYWGVQIDAATGNLLHVERRRSDLIENVHDGSILDVLFGTTDGQIKLAYTSIMGVALLSFTITGFWLWLGPKRMRALSKQPH